MLPLNHPLFLLIVFSVIFAVSVLSSIRTAKHKALEREPQLAGRKSVANDRMPVSAMHGSRVSVA